jgi:TPR repeat protein
MVGYCYDCVLDINEQPNIAIDWYEKAANNGNIIAMCNLGYCYKYGKSVGIEKDISKVIKKLLNKVIHLPK